MKKWIGALCSGLAGALTLIFLALPGLAYKINFLGFKESDTTSGWKMLTEGKSDMTALTWYRIFAWIVVVLAIVLIVLAVLQVLANLNVIKMPEILAKVNNFALIALVLVSILALIANFGIRAEMIKEMGGKDVLESIGTSVSVGASLWLVSIVNLVAVVCANVFAKAKD